MAFAKYSGCKNGNFFLNLKPKYNWHVIIFFIIQIESGTHMDCAHSDYPKLDVAPVNEAGALQCLQTDECTASKKTAGKPEETLVTHRKCISN